MNLLEWYEIVLWKKGGKYFVSQDTPVTVARLASTGYEFVDTMDGFSDEVGRLKADLAKKGIGQWEISKLLDDQECDLLEKAKKGPKNLFWG